MINVSTWSIRWVLIIIEWVLTLILNSTQRIDQVLTLIMNSTQLISWVLILICLSTNQFIHNELRIKFNFLLWTIQYKLNFYDKICIRKWARNFEFSWRAYLFWPIVSGSLTSSYEWNNTREIKKAETKQKVCVYIIKGKKICSTRWTRSHSS